MANYFLNRLWPGLLVWVALYISDYILTLVCARLYRQGAAEKIQFEGSYEITPFFQRDIDLLRRVSPRFLGTLLFFAAALSGLWWLGRTTVPEGYHFVLGMLISIQLAVHMRHWRNFFLFRALLRNHAFQGRIEYPRGPMLRLSALELVAFAGFFGVLFLFTGSWFVLGGVVGCLVVANKHWRLAQAAGLNPPKVE